MGKGLDKTLQDGTFSHPAFGSGTNDNWLVLDNTLWDLRLLQPIRLVETDQILQTAFRSDGQVVIVAGKTGYYSSEISVYVKNKANRIKDQILLTVPDGDITDVKISEDGRWIATTYSTYTYAGNQGGIQLWDTMNLSVLLRFLSLTSNPQALAITHDGSKMAIVEAKLYNLFLKILMQILQQWILAGVGN